MKVLFCRMPQQTFMSVLKRCADSSVPVLMIRCICVVGRPTGEESEYGMIQ